MKNVIITENDEIVARYILVLLRMDLKKVFSWGFQYPRIVSNGIRAYVNGFLYQGYIEITLNSGKDLFEVKTFNDDGTVKDRVEDIYFDKLVDTIDNLVEYCENYEEKVNLTYGL